MKYSVSEFIETHPEIKTMYGYDKFMRDVTRVKKPLEHGLICSNLLSNYYGNPAEESLCCAFRRYAYGKMTEGGITWK